MSRPRIVYITDHVLNPRAGYGFRVANTLEGLRSIGDVTTVFLSRSVDDDEWPDGDVLTVDATEYRLRTGYPLSLIRARPRDSMYANRREVARSLRSVIDDEVDLVWVYRSRPMDAVGPAMPTGERAGVRLVIDLDDLYDLHYAMLADRRLTPSAVRRLGYRLDGLLWRRHHRRVMNQADLALVTSNQDRRHVGYENTAVLANGYPEPTVVSPPVDSVGVDSRTDGGIWRMLFVGGYHYPPNADAARQLATEVLPRVRRELPEAELLLVGRPTAEVERLGRLPGVRYEGFPETLDDAFALADVVVTPIRAGGGSRLKAVEAMARNKPLVSSAFGVQGFDVTDDYDVLIANDAERQAVAVVRLQREPGLCHRLASNARATYQKLYSSEAVARRTAELAAQCLASAPRSGR